MAHFACRDLREFESLFKKHNKQRMKRLGGAVKAIAGRSKMEAKKNAPKAFNELRLSIHLERILNGWSVVADAPYAEAVEHGRRPGRMPPFEPIFMWVWLKIPAGSLEETARIARAVQRKIGREGTQPTKFMKMTEHFAVDIMKRYVDAAMSDDRLLSDE